MAEKGYANEVLDDPELADYYKKRKVLYETMTTDPDAQRSVDWFQKEAVTYDRQFEKAGFGYPALLAEAVETFVEDKQAKILDVAAGSGKVALKLRERGYSNIDGVDGSSKMLDIAKEKNAYNRYICCMVGSEKMPEVRDSHYDVVCCGGGIARSHLPVESIPTMLRAAKKDGYLLFNHQSWSAQFDEFSDEKFEKCFEELKQTKVCSSVEKRMSELRPGEPSIIFILRRGEGVPT